MRLAKLPEIFLTYNNYYMQNVSHPSLIKIKIHIYLDNFELYEIGYQSIVTTWTR